MTALPDRLLATWRRLPRPARISAAGAACLLIAWAVALAVANRPSARLRLRAAIREVASRRLPGVEVGDGLSVDPLFRVSFGPVTVPAVRRGAPPLLRIEKVKVRARWTAVLLGRLEPASVRLYGVRLEPGERLAELRALSGRLQSPPPRRAEGSEVPAAQAPARAWPALHLRGLVVALPGDGRAIELGPLDASLLRRRVDGSDVLSLDARARGGGRLTARLRRSEAGFDAAATLDDLSPGAVPATLAAGTIRWTGGTVGGSVELSGGAGSAVSGRIRARLDRATFEGKRLAAAPVGPIAAALEAGLEADTVLARVALRRGQLRLLETLDASLEAEARVAPGFPFSFTLDVPAVDFGALVGALPPVLRPPAEAPRPAGPLGLHAALSGPLRDPAAWDVDVQLDLSRLREAARRAPPVALRSPFTWTPEPEEGQAKPPALVVGPEDPAFAPIAELPPHVVRAVTTSEDAGFFAHPGFDFEELRNAFAQGAEAGHVVRGGSTITQQLAKNLYLSRERTLARKIREAAVAIGMEATVPKARLLEIYLNIAEWGPGIWGIGHAAQHYFGKPARDLSPREAAFLASIIPNPVRFHAYYERGELDEAWTERLRVLLLKMAEAGALTEDQLLAALDEPLRFASRTAALEDGPAPDGLAPATEPGAAAP